MSERGEVRIASKSDPGCQRTHNEDSFGLLRDGERTLVILADGMGGESGGATASKVAVGAALRAMRGRSYEHPRTLIGHALEAANVAVREVKAQRSDLARMGTTLVIVVIEGYECWYGWVGDSRIYLVSQQTRQISRDHSRVQSMMDAGILTPDEASVHPERHVLSQAIGVTDKLELPVSTAPVSLEPGRALVLCTDGLSDLVSPEEIGWHARQFSAEVACQRLVELAKQRGGHDNITVQVIQHPRLPIRRPLASLRRSSQSRGRHPFGTAFLVLAAVIVAAGASLYLLGWPGWLWSTGEPPLEGQLVWRSGDDGFSGEDLPGLSAVITETDGVKHAVLEIAIATNSAWMIVADGDEDGTPVVRQDDIEIKCYQGEAVEKHKLSHGFWAKGPYSWDHEQNNPPSFSFKLDAEHCVTTLQDPKYPIYRRQPSGPPIDRWSLQLRVDESSGVNKIVIQRILLAPLEDDAMETVTGEGASDSDAANEDNRGIREQRRSEDRPDSVDEDGDVVERPSEVEDGEGLIVEEGADDVLEDGSAADGEDGDAAR